MPQRGRAAQRCSVRGMHCCATVRAAVMPAYDRRAHAHRTRRTQLAPCSAGAHGATASAARAGITVPVAVSPHAVPAVAIVPAPVVAAPVMPVAMAVVPAVVGEAADDGRGLVPVRSAVVAVGWPVIVVAVIGCRIRVAVRRAVTVGVVGALLMPMLAAIGAIAALVTECTITVERDDKPVK